MMCDVELSHCLKMPDGKGKGMGVSTLHGHGLRHSRSTDQQTTVNSPRLASVRTIVTCIMYHKFRLLIEFTAFWPVLHSRVEWL